MLQAGSEGQAEFTATASLRRPQGPCAPWQGFHQSQMGHRGAQQHPWLHSQEQETGLKPGVGGLGVSKAQFHYPGPFLVGVVGVGISLEKGLRAHWEREVTSGARARARVL